jgi:hypothetical protein
MDAGRSPCFQLSKEQFVQNSNSEYVPNLQAKGIVQHLSLDTCKKTIVLICTAKSAHDFAICMGIPLPEPTGLPLLKCEHCGKLTLDVKFPSCKHVACNNCFDDRIQVAASDITHDHFPLRCWHKDCQEPISISVLRDHTTEETFKLLMQASLT